MYKGPLPYWAGPPKLVQRPHALASPRLLPHLALHQTDGRTGRRHFCNQGWGKPQNKRAGL